ncbi:MAG: arginyltransferase [Myxococcales bacterium FL481]|nr:MAG: arginyltransferase [Myxococcales bacterium FL481]
MLIHDESTRCPYLEDKTSRLPMRLPVRPLSDQEFDQRLQSGDRRQGLLLYRTACPGCNACEPIRIDTREYQLSKTQRRIRRAGDKRFRVQVERPHFTPEKLALYNKHKVGRGLLGRSDPIDRAGYTAFLVDSCADSYELQYFDGDRLVGVAIVDRSCNSLSAVYTYYDPQYNRDSVGVYSILRQLQLCLDWGLRHLYLGLYIEQCESMAYKARYLPHERRLDGQWVRFDKPPKATAR